MYLAARQFLIGNRRMFDHFYKKVILITFKNEVKIMRNCLIINVIFIQNDTLWVYQIYLFEYILIPIQEHF